MAHDNQVETPASSTAQGGYATSAFELIHDGFPLLQSTDVKQKLLQWNLNESLQIKRFRVLRKMSKDQDLDLIQEFFSDPTVQTQLNTPPPKTTLAIESLRVTVTSLAFFDKLIDAKLVAESGALRRCLDEIYDGATASDAVKEMFINPDTDNTNVFTDNEENEFIFHLFRAFVIGGSLCQSDEWLAIYTDMAKRFYRALVAVKKNAADRHVIDITSRVYRIDSDALFTSSSRFSTCFVVLDAKKRLLTIWQNPFRPFW